jgi:hypothetical protein
MASFPLFAVGELINLSQFVISCSINVSDCIKTAPNGQNKWYMLGSLLVDSHDNASLSLVDGERLAACVQYNLKLMWLYFAKMACALYCTGKEIL